MTKNRKTSQEHKMYDEYNIEYRDNILAKA